MYDGSLTDWLDELVPIDALLKEPLDIGGSAARRRTLAKILMRAMGWSMQLDRPAVEGPPVADTTIRLFFYMLDGLAETRTVDRVAIRESAGTIARGYSAPAGISRVDAVQAMLDLGWSHIEIRTGTVQDMLNAVRVAYCGEMTARLELLLRHWERNRWITAAS